MNGGRSILFRANVSSIACSWLASGYMVRCSEPQNRASLLLHCIPTVKMEPGAGEALRGRGRYSSKSVKLCKQENLSLISRPMWKSWVWWHVFAITVLGSGARRSWGSWLNQSRIIGELQAHISKHQRSYLKGGIQYLKMTLEIVVLSPCTRAPHTHWMHITTYTCTYTCAHAPLHTRTDTHRHMNTHNVHHKSTHMHMHRHLHTHTYMNKHTYNESEGLMTLPWISKWIRSKNIRDVCTNLCLYQDILEDPFSSH